MNRPSLIKVALRLNAIFVDTQEDALNSFVEPNEATVSFVASLQHRGFTVSEKLLRAISTLPNDRLKEITGVINEVLGIRLNWASLVRGWDEPTGETRIDHLATWLAQLMETWGVKVNGVRLKCGHLIPDGTFNLERYTGCPFCGTPFETAQEVNLGQGSQLRTLNLMTEPDMRRLLSEMLTSPTPLDGTQEDSLKILLSEYGLPDGIEIPMHETVAIVGKMLLDLNRPAEAQRLVKTPNDILRILWYEKTECAMVIKPKLLIKNAMRASHNMCACQDRSTQAELDKKKSLHLHFGRGRCRIIAKWLNELPMSPQQACETMNPTRGMWVRLIRALRLSEFARKEGFSRLAELLDVFYNQKYTTWNGELERLHKEGDADGILRALSGRPGAFARNLFATMLRLGSDITLDAFNKIADKLPARLLVSLGNAAELYFDPEEQRVVRTIMGTPKCLPHHPLMEQTSPEERESMYQSVRDIFVNTMRRKFAKQRPDASSTSRSIFIAKELYDIPIDIGDRSTAIQDTSCAPMGTRFKVEGDAVRLFLQWGVGLSAQHLDMDLSSVIAFEDGTTEYCSYFNLTATGAKHSGDIQHIPDKVGTAEYIELTLSELENANATYVVFTCNAYTNGTLSPNLMVGWMNSKFPMSISEENGVAYDPSCVQHIVRIGTANLSKGLVFGVLDVKQREITWLEVPFMGQTAKSMDYKTIRAYLRRLRNKTTIGEILDIKAEAQHLAKTAEAADADEVYSREWALNSVAVNNLLFG